MFQRLSVFVIVLIIVSPLCAIGQSDVQITLQESAINLVLKKALQGSELEEPCLTFRRNRFSFEAIYPVSVIFFNITSVPLKFVGDVKADRGDVIINISEYHQDGEIQDKELTVKRIRAIAESINEACDENEQTAIRARYVPSEVYCGSLKLDMRNFQFLPALPDLKIKDIRLENEFITIASTEKQHQNSQAEIQAYIGEEVINGLLAMYTQQRKDADLSIQSLKVDVSDNASDIRVEYSTPGQRNSLSMNVSASLPAVNLVNLKINSHQSACQIDFESVLWDIIRVVNRNIQATESKVRGEKMHFTYGNGTISFMANFNDIIPLSIRPDVFHLSGQADHVSIFASVDEL